MLERDASRGTRPAGTGERRRAELRNQMDLPGMGDSLDRWLRQNGYSDIAERIEAIVSNLAPKRTADTTELVGHSRG